MKVLSSHQLFQTMSKHSRNCSRYAVVYHEMHGLCIPPQPKVFPFTLDRHQTYFKIHFIHCINIIIVIKFGIVGNSKQKWENMLTEITNMEYMVVKCHSIIRKLFPNQEEFEPKVNCFSVYFSSTVIDSITARRSGMRLKMFGEYYSLKSADNRNYLFFITRP